MPDSPPQSKTNHDQRFAIGVTRVCLTSGTLQIPFAMRGIFEPGSYPVLDTERDETTELVFDPPRSLRGLEEIFAAHELQPNDEVILTITGEGLELDVKKRPRRKAPHAKRERWESVSGRQATADKDHAPSERVRLEGGQPQLFDHPTDERGQRPVEAHAPEDEDADAPRIVRARRVDRADDRPRMQAPQREPVDADARERPAAEAADRAAQRESAARRFFEDPGDPDDPYSAEPISEETWQWERSASEAPARATAADPAVPASGGFFAKIAQAARGAFSFRGAEDERHAGHAGARPQRSDPPSERSESRHEPPHDPRREPPEAHTARDREPSGRPQRPQSEPAPRAPAPRATPASEAAPSSPPRNVVVEDAEAETMDRFGPAMWELGEGDLRQRLIRFLQHPDVPVILRTEMVARNLGLGQEVAAAMLEDLSHDKIDGLVVTKVRDDTYRISRAPSKL